MTRRLRITGPVLGAVCLLALTGCGGDDDGDQAATDPGGPTSGSTSSAAQECPDTLPEQESGDEFGAAEPAAEAPEIPEAESAWVCTYLPGKGSGDPTWALEGDAVALDDNQLADVTTDLGDLQPLKGRPICTEDIGPRYLVVMDTGDGLTSVAVDDFGCGFARVLGDPTTDGADATPGVLTAPGSLVTTLGRVAG